MKKYWLLKYGLIITILSNMAFECGCKKPTTQISHLHVSITFQQAVLYLEDGRVPFTLTIKSEDALAKDLKYTCVDWLVKDNVGKLVGASGETIDPGYQLVYGDNQLYYQPHAVGNHMLELTVSDEQGSLQKKQLVTLSVKDHLPIDFQVALKPEKSSTFIHEPVKLIVDISSRQKEASELTYQIKEISTAQKGVFSATMQGTPIGPNYDLSYGKNTLYYNNIDKEPGVHDMKLVVVSSKGDTQAISACLNILDTDFQAQVQLQKPAILFYEKAKLMVDITAKQEGMDKLAYQIKEISTSGEGGEFLSTAQGSKISPGHGLVYGKNTLYYHPKGQLGTHDIKLVVTNSNGNTKTILTSLEVLDVDFQVKLKPEKPTIFFYEEAKMRIEITSPQEGSDKLTYQIQELSTNKKGYFSLTSQGEPIGEKQALNYGKGELYYHPQEQLGGHEIKLVVTSGNGNTKTVLASLAVLDIDFQVKLKPEKPTIFFYEEAKMRIEITSPQEGGDKLTYQIQELSTNKKGYFSLTSQGEPIGEKQALNYGKGELYYHPQEQLGGHEMKLVVVNSKGDTKTVLASLEVLDIDFQVKLKPERPTIFFYEQAKINIEITSPQEGGDKLTYQIQELSTNKKGCFSLEPEGEPMGEKHTLGCGKNMLYYQPKGQLGKHELKLVVKGSSGNTKTVLASLEVLDIDFGVKMKPEKTPSFSHDPIKLVVDISAKQEGGQQSTYQLKEIDTSIQGGEFLTAPQDGTPITTGQTLQHGKNEWYYIPHQPGKHEIQLLVVNSHGTSQEATLSLEVRDPDFQVEVKPEKTTIFSHEQIKLNINISATQAEASKLGYELKGVTTSIETGQLSTTPQGVAVSSGQALEYGKNVWYYTPHEPGSHTVQLAVANNKGVTKQAKALVIANKAIFTAEVKIEKPTKSADRSFEIRLLLRSNSHLKEEKWELASWQLEEPGIGKLEDQNGYQVAEKGVVLQPGINIFKLIVNQVVTLKKVPQLKLAIIEPDGKEKQLAVDVGSCVLAQLGKPLQLLEEQYKVACQKLMDREPAAQGKLDAVIHQLKPLRSNLDILAQSTAINRDHVETASAAVDQMVHHSNEKALVSQAVQTKFGRGIHEKDQHGRTPLIEAIDKRDIEGLDLVLRHPDVDLKIRHPFKNSTVSYPLLSYVILQERNDVTILEKLLQAGASVHDRVLINRQSLHDNQVEKPEWSPRHKVSSQESQGETALHLAAAGRLMEPITLLLKHGANINDKNSYWQTPLHLVIYPMDEKETKETDELALKLIQYLIDRGAFIEAQDLNDNTPLHYAAFRLWKDMDKLLQKNGADARIKNWVYGKDKRGKQLDEEGEDVEDMWWG